MAIHVEGRRDIRMSHESLYFLHVHLLREKHRRIKVAKIIGTVFWPFDCLSPGLDVFHEPSLQTSHIEAPLTPIARTLPFAVRGRENQVIIVDHAAMLGIGTHHVERLGTDLNKTAPLWRFGHGYLLAATLNGALDFDAIVVDGGPGKRQVFLRSHA